MNDESRLDKDKELMRVTALIFLVWLIVVAYTFIAKSAWTEVLEVHCPKHELQYKSETQITIAEAEKYAKPAPERLNVAWPGVFFLSLLYVSGLCGGIVATVAVLRKEWND